MKDDDRRRFNGKNQPGRKITDEQILDGISAGMTRQDIADLYGVHVENLARRMKRLGVHAKYAEHAKPRVIFGGCWHYVEAHKKKCDERHPSFEYLESRTQPKRVRLKCKECGRVIERATSTFRQKNILCDNCENDRKLIDARGKLLQALLEIKDIKTPKTCKTCGGVFYSPYQTQMYCSPTCRGRQKRKGNSYRSRCRKYGVHYDASVTREAVIKRDGYICQICGKPTDPNDREWGTIGPMFPTVDHIIALANGGTHTWDNVQCAHAICNSYKRDLWGYKLKGALVDLELR